MGAHLNFLGKAMDSHGTDAGLEECFATAVGVGSTCFIILKTAVKLNTCIADCWGKQQWFYEQVVPAGRGF